VAEQPPRCHQRLRYSGYEGANAEGNEDCPSDQVHRATLVAGQGLTAVSMSSVAQEAGIGRATLYKYFDGIEAILLAWHQRQVSSHLQELKAAVHGNDDPWERLTAVLSAYAHMLRYSGGDDVAAALHQSEHVAHAQQHLSAIFKTVLGEAADAGVVRTDITVAELSGYCLAALSAARTTRSKAAADRVAELTFAAVRS
jgi:AcrR family transcriptional regulator